MLLMEFHGSPAGVKEQAETVQELASGHGGNAFEWATTPEERTRLWTARHNAYFAAIQSRPGCRAISTDTCVPISRLADCLLESVAEADASGIPYFLVGHVGDGNFHFGYLIDPDDAEQQEGGYLTDLITDHGLDFVRRMAGGARSGTPFFLSLHYTAPHWPWETRDDEALAQEVKGNLFHLHGGNIDTYRRMIHHMDEGIGRLMDLLRAEGLERDTLVVFTSDNGGERFSDN